MVLIIGNYDLTSVNRETQKHLELLERIVPGTISFMSFSSERLQAHIFLAVYIRWHFKWNFMGFIFQENISTRVTVFRLAGYIIVDCVVGTMLSCDSDWDTRREEIEEPLETTAVHRWGGWCCLGMFSNNITPKDSRSRREILKCQLQHLEIYSKKISNLNICQRPTNLLDHSFKRRPDDDVLLHLPLVGG